MIRDRRNAGGLVRRNRRGHRAEKPPAHPADYRFLQEQQNKFLRAIEQGVERKRLWKETDEQCKQRMHEISISNEAIQKACGFPTVKTMIDRAKLRFWGSLEKGDAEVSGAITTTKKKFLWKVWCWRVTFPCGVGPVVQHISRLTTHLSSAFRRE